MNPHKTFVSGRVEVEQTYKKVKGYFLIFPTEHWEKVSQTTIGNDIYITTDHEIRNVYLNGKIIST